MTNDKFSVRLKQALIENNMTQMDLSKKTNIDRTLINKYLKNVSSPKDEKLKKIANTLNVNPVWLMGYDVSKEIDKIKELEKDEENYQIKIMIHYFKELSKEQQKDVIDYIEFIKSKK